MIRRFRQVSDHLYRGSAPSPHDLRILKKLGIKKIVSLDEASGRRINRAAKLLGFKHVMLPINIARKSTLLNFLSHDIPKLFDEDGPTFVHCAQGKDRTGLACAMYRCEAEGWSCGKALKEAKNLGFGLGVDPRIINLYKKIIKKSCGCTDKDLSDVNHAYDIVSNEREYPTWYAGYTTDAWEQGSWSPFEDYRVREFPAAGVDIDWPDQYPSRTNYGLDDSKIVDISNVDIPQSGQWDTSTNGIMGAGPSFVGSGYV